MTKKTAITSLTAVCIVGSIVCFYATNLIESDIANMFYMTVTKDCISSLPIFFIALDFELLAIAIIRLYMRPQYTKAEIICYLKILIGFSAAGTLSSLYTGTAIYGTFTAPYPFKGAVIICLVIHFFLLQMAVIVLRNVRKMPPDKAVRKMTFKYVFYTIFLSVLVFFAFNRFGAVLLSPLYVSRGSVGASLLFYLSLMLPMALLGHLIIVMFVDLEKHPKLSLSYVIGILLADIVLAFLVIYIGMTDTQFVSAVSPALGIERLLAKPVDTIFHFILVFVLGLYSLWYAIKTRKVNNK